MARKSVWLGFLFIAFILACNGHVGAQSKGSRLGSSFPEPTDVGEKLTHSSLTIDGTASITGRVTSRSGRSISNAKVQLFDANGENSWCAFTNSFGYYRFDMAEVGVQYVVSVGHKRYLFVEGTTSLIVAGNTTGIDFIASN